MSDQPFCGNGIALTKQKFDEAFDFSIKSGRLLKFFLSAMFIDFYAKPRSDIRKNTDKSVSAMKHKRNTRRIISAKEALLGGQSFHQV